MFENIYNLIYQAIPMPDNADLNLKQQRINTCKFKNSPLKTYQIKTFKDFINIMKLSELCNLRQ